MSVEALVQEIFDEPDFQSHGLLSDFRLERGFDTHHVRIISRDWNYKVIEVLRKSGQIGEIKRTNYFKDLEELDLHIRNIRKGYHDFTFVSKF